MQNVSILGVGQTPVAKQPGQSIGRLASRACQAAIAAAGVEDVDAIFVGNMLSGDVTGQSHLGPLISAAIGAGRTDSEQHIRMEI
jgi:acetyl-CoA acetyltransferase